MSAEHALRDEVDSNAPRFVRKLVDRHPNILPLSQEERVFLCRLILRTILRNPTTLDVVVQDRIVQFALKLLSLSRKLSLRSKNDDAKMRLGQDRVLRGELNHKVATFEIDQQIKYLTEMKFVFLLPEEGVKNFILGSQPYLLNPYAKTQGSDGECNDCSLCLALHPRLLVTLYDEAGEDALLAATVEDVNRINGLFLKYSNSVVMVNYDDIDGAWYYEHPPPDA